MYARFKSRGKLSVILFAFLSLMILVSAISIRPAAATQASLVIGVARWRQDGTQYQNVQSRTFDRIEQQLQELQLDVEVVKIPVELKNADSVDSIALQYGTDVVIWGWYDEVAVRGYVDLANSTEENGMSNSLGQYLENGGSPDVIRVLKMLSDFDYAQDGISFCVPRWTP